MNTAKLTKNIPTVPCSKEQTKKNNNKEPQVFGSDTCVICGKPIPEGYGHVCKQCSGENN